MSRTYSRQLVLSLAPNLRKSHFSTGVDTVNAKRVYRIYREENLTVRTATGKKRSAQARVPLREPTYANQRWSMDFVSDKLEAGSWFRILTVVDQYTRECLCAEPDRPQTAAKVVAQMKRLVALRGAPESITTDNGSEFAGRAMETWAYQNDVKLDLMRTGQARGERLHRKLQRTAAR